MNQITEPIEVKNKIGKYNYSFSSLELDVSVTFDVYLFDEKEQMYKNSQLRIEGDLYNNWGQDDNYIINIIKNNIENILNTDSNIVIAK